VKKLPTRRSKSRGTVKVISLLYKGDYYEHYLFIYFWVLFMTGMKIGEASAL